MRETLPQLNLNVIGLLSARNILQRIIRCASSIFIIFTKLSSSIFFGLKGTGRVVSSDPPYKVDNALFITVPLKALSDLILIIYECL